MNDARWVKMGIFAIILQVWRSITSFSSMRAMIVLGLTEE